MPPLNLVGRQAELAALRDGLARLARGDGSLAVLSGEPGIGKTALADAIAREAAERGVRVARGAAWDGGDAPAYWPWIEALRAMVEPGALREGQRRELAPLLGAPQAPRESATGELARFQLFDGLRALLAERAARERWLIVLEDLHAADRGSLLATLYVARALRSLPVFVVVTHRDAEARLDAELGDALARLSREGTVLPLARLERADVAALLASLDAVDDALLDAIHDASGGNPLFVHETVRLVRTGARPGPSASAIGILHERLARFGPAERRALEAAAVLGRAFDAALLADVIGVTSGELDARLRGPRLAGIVQRADGGLRFGHALFRTQLLDELSAEDRASLHARAAEAWARARARGVAVPEETIALHYAAAVPVVPAERAIEPILSAATALMADLAYDRAVDLFGKGRALIDEARDPGRAIDVELQLANALLHGGAAARARELCAVAAARARALGDPERMARCALAHGADIRPGVVDRTLVALLEEAEAALGDRMPGLGARLLARRAAALQPAPDPSVPMELARAAIARAREVGDPETLLAVVHTAGSALVDYAHPEDRAPLARELIAMAMARRDLVLAQRGQARLAIDLFELGDLAGCERAVVAHDRLGRALGHPRWRWRGALFDGMLASWRGDFARAAAAGREAEAITGELEDFSAGFAVQLHRLAVGIGQESAEGREALAVVAAIEALAAPGGPASRQIDLDHDYAAIVLETMSAAVRARYGERTDASQVPSDRAVAAAVRSRDPTALALLAGVAADLEAPELARRVAPALDAIGERVLSWGVMSPAWQGPTSGVRGVVHRLLGEHERAVDSLEDALETVLAMDGRACAVRLRYELARALLGRASPGDVARAGRLAAEAREEAERLGMTVLAARIDRLGVAASAAATPATPELVEHGHEGDVFTLARGPERASFKRSRATEILETLMERPGEEVHVLDLSPAEGPIDLGDAGPMLDEKAKAQYRRRILELRAALEQAEEWADLGAQARARAELEILEDELTGAVGLGGRDRKTGAAAERARVNVQKRLRGLIKKLRASAPGLADHLESSIKTGTYVSYAP